mgnify:CR=1 FL=1
MPSDITPPDGRALDGLWQLAGAPKTLPQALLDICTLWPEPEVADEWRRVIAVYEYQRERERIDNGGKNETMDR